MVSEVERGLQLVVVAARGVELGLGLPQRQPVGLGVEREQFVARLDVLAFDAPRYG